MIKIERNHPIEEEKEPIEPDQEHKAIDEMSKLQLDLQDIEEEQPMLYSERNVKDLAEYEVV